MPHDDDESSGARPEWSSPADEFRRDPSPATSGSGKPCTVKSMNTSKIAAIPTRPSFLASAEKIEIGVEIGIQIAAARQRERSLAEACAGKTARGDRVERFHQLVAGALLAPASESSARGTVLPGRPGMQPDRHAVANVCRRFR